MKFIKGDDNLKSFTEFLQKTDVGMKFPPGAQAHVVRRAVVRCGTTSPGPCTRGVAAVVAGAVAGVSEGKNVVAENSD